MIVYEMKIVSVESSLVAVTCSTVIRSPR